MDEFEDYSEEISRRRARLSREKLLCCVTASHVADEGLNKVYRELDVDSCLGYDWKKLAGKLLNPPPTRARIVEISNCKSKSCEVLKTWVLQSGESKTFDSLIETMVECKLYSACDELLDFLEVINLEERHETEDINAANELKAEDAVKNRSDDQTSEFYQPNRNTSHGRNQQERSRNLDEIVPVDVDVSDVTSEQPKPTSRVEREQPQQRPQQDSSRSPSRVERSTSLDSRRGFRKFLKNIFRRSNSSPADLPSSSTTTPSPPRERTPPPKDEIFIVSSFSDNKTKGMKEMMSFVKKLKPVKNRELTVRTIHDVDQGGKVTTAWLEERVMRARYVIVCFSSDMNSIYHASQLERQADYNLKFTIEFLVAGTIFDNGCRNPDGKFIPVLLDGQDRSAIIVSLRHFQNFCWPDEQERIMKYILNLPEYPVPPQGSPKPLVQKEIIC